MKIKKISMMGFKSFMDRLEISLPTGISAIVGPNGCGKSNMVDAVRWAMGEQSAKSLRGRSMEDVIFNGADRHKPMGMAEVSLVFENGDGSFPRQFANYSELCITRRLYRSGESEYLINNVPCRLKDIQEIFMDTGLGNRAYSIISQGMITSIVEQKPEETRAMLEEAAGITKYKKKVEESRRKIELTKGNLVRVEDILGEIERQMRSLKYQASKARRFKKLSKEIRRLELVLNANTYRELREESVSRERSTQDLVQEEVSKSTEFSRIQARIQSMGLELEEKDDEISRLREAYLKVKEKVNKMESLLDTMEGEKRMQTELRSRLEKEKEELGRRVKDLQREKDVIRDRIEQLRQTSADLQGEIEIAKKRIQGRHEHLVKVKEEYEDAKERLNRDKSRQMSLSQESGYLSKKIGEITDAYSRLEKEKEETAEKIKKIMRISETKAQVREALGKRLDEIEGDYSGEQQKMAELESLKKDLESELREAEAAQNALETRLGSLRSLIENFEGYKVGVRTIMKANDLDARKEGRIHGLVADLIDVEPRYEQAVEGLLADRLQYIIVETQSDGKEAVQYLKDRAKGRSSFIPLKEIKGVETQGNERELPLLRDLVTVPEAYKPVLDLLLGNAVFVDDLDQALALWKDNGRGYCLVTPQGDIVDEKGVITGGKTASSTQGLLARKREMQDLEAKIVAGRERLTDTREKLHGVQEEIEQRKKSLDELTEEKWRCQEEINDLDKVMFRLAHELEQLESLSQKISREMEQREKDHRVHEQDLERIRSELQSCSESMAQKQRYVLDRELELKECQEEYEKIREEVASLKMDHSLSQEEERGLRREVQRIDEFTEEALGSLKRIEEDIGKAERHYKDIEDRQESLREELRVLLGVMEQAEGRVKIAEHHRNRFQNAMKEEERRVDGLRRELEELKERIHRARMQHSEIGFKMRSLEDLVRDKYAADLKDIYQEYLEENFSPVEAKERLEREREKRDRLGEVNLTAIQEHEALEERYKFIHEQREDLLKSIESLNQAIRKINRTSLERFRKTFAEVDQKLKEVFPILFKGGTAGLKLLDETRPLESGVLVEVQPPGKKLSHMGLLSGGEKALVAMALLFAIYLVKPSPFCVLDEVDAPLDEANIDRFNNLLNEIKKSSQVILVTHNKRSMEIVDRLYGVTMEKKGISKLVSVDLEGIRKN
ncbi:MAG: chromosome segregation protein SMC [Deltaproteobacteria bacterium]|nr:chromosome segregation protein SMC [Deltaproteobacteria bacterium]